jgi:hypothetical protein
MGNRLALGLIALTAFVVCLSACLSTTERRLAFTGGGRDVVVIDRSGSVTNVWLPGDANPLELIPSGEVRVTNSISLRVLRLAWGVGGCLEPPTFVVDSRDAGIALTVFAGPPCQEQLYQVRQFDLVFSREVPAQSVEASLVQRYYVASDS